MEKLKALIKKHGAIALALAALLGALTAYSSNTIDDKGVSILTNFIESVLSEEEAAE